MSNTEELQNPSTSSEEEKFVFRWRIENIKCFYHYSLTSPVFYTKFLEDTAWIMQLANVVYGGICCVTCTLFRTDWGPEEIDVKFTMDVNDINVDNYLDAVTFRKNSTNTTTPGCHKNRALFIHRITQKRGRKDLHVECVIWRAKSPSAAIRENIPRIYSAFTLIPVERWECEYSIKNFNANTLNVDYSFAPTLHSAPYLKLSFSKARSQEANKLLEGILEIQMLNWRSTFNRYGSYLKCKLQMKDVRNRYHDLGEVEHLFTTNKLYLEYNVYDIITVENRNDFLPSDTLTLKCEFDISYEKPSSGLEFIGFDDSPKPPDNRSAFADTDLEKYFEYYNEHKYFFRFLLALVIFLVLVPRVLF